MGTVRPTGRSFFLRKCSNLQLTEKWTFVTADPIAQQQRNIDTVILTALKSSSPDSPINGDAANRGQFIPATPMLGCTHTVCSLVCVSRCLSRKHLKNYQLFAFNFEFGRESQLSRY